jgi:hypothetical protein
MKRLLTNGAPLAFGLIAVLSWVGVSWWLLEHNPTEAERSAIQKTAEVFAAMAFGFFLGSSLGSKQKSEAAENPPPLDLTNEVQ